MANGHFLLSKVSFSRYGWFWIVRFFAYKLDQLKPSSSPGNYRFFFPSYGLLARGEISRIDTIQGCAGKIKAALSSWRYRVRDSPLPKFPPFAVSLANEFDIDTGTKVAEEDDNGNGETKVTINGAESSNLVVKSYSCFCRLSQGFLPFSWESARISKIRF